MSRCAQPQPEGQAQFPLEQLANGRRESGVGRGAWTRTGKRVRSRVAGQRWGWEPRCGREAASRAGMEDTLALLP